MYTPKNKRIKLDGPVFTTPLKFDDDGESVSSPKQPNRSTPLNSGGRKRVLRSNLRENSTSNTDADGATDAGGSGLGVADSSPCSNAEYLTLKQELRERNSQRDNLLLKIKDLTENNKRYKDHLEKESSRRQQVTVLQKTYSSELTDRDRLIASLQAVIEDHERTVQQLEQRLYGSQTAITTTASSPSSAVSPACVAVPSDGSAGFSSSGSGGIAHLVSEIRTLQQAKSQLVSQLAEAQGQLEMCELDHVEKIRSLQNCLAERDKAAQLKEGDDKENIGQAATDTEKQLEKMEVENHHLTAEISSLHRFYTRNNSLSYGPEAERLRRLEEENKDLRIQLQSCQALQQERERQVEEGEEDLMARMDLLLADKHRAERQLSMLRQQMSSIKEYHSSHHRTESFLREEISGAHTDQRRTAQQLRDLQAKWTALQARDPDVVTKIVQVEVQSEDLKDQVNVLERKVKEWESRCVDRDRKVADLHKQLEHLSDKLKKGEEEKQLLQSCLLEEVEKERQSRELAVSDARRQAERQTYELRVANQHMRLQAAHLASNLEALKQAYQLLAREARQFPQRVALVVGDVCKQVVDRVQSVTEENKDLVRKYHMEMRLRKKYHNELVELKGNIRVLCRVRPPIREDGTGSQADIVVNYDPDDDGLIYISNKGRIQTFEFDRVFSASSSQTQVFDEVRALVTSCIDGFNICIFAYGQTGSGKTFTMEGPVEDPGINQRALLELFAETADKGQDWTFTIEVSVLEIYNEMIRDLLNADSGNKMEVKMRADGGGYYVPGLVTKVVTSLQEVNQVFAEGRRNRATATTNMNEHSSRSHCLLCVTVSGVNRTTNSRSFGRLNLVDLAGSERVSKSGADGMRLREAQNINKSLACLGDVIHALRVKQSHIPFRNSKLTFLLQDSLGGDSKTLMIVQVAPVEKNVSETVCSLSFGQRVRTVELGPATRKIEAGDIEHTKSPVSPTSTPGSPPLKRKVLSPKSPSTSTSTPRYTPIKHSPATSSSASRLLRSTRK